MQFHALQTLQFKIQAIILSNQVVFYHLSTSWHIDLEDTSCIYAHYSILEKYSKIEQTTNI